MLAEKIIVHNSQELSAAINKLSDGAGGTIEVVNAGEAYSISKYRAGTDAGEIRVVAADPEDRPVFEQVKLVQGQNIVFSGMSFDSVGSTLEGKDLQILKCKDITFENSTFFNASHGFYTGKDDGAELGGSLGLVRDSSGFVFSGNQVSNYYQGLAVIDSIGTVVVDNTFLKMTGDGLRLSGVQDTLIEGNLFADFNGSTQNVNHSDMIQVWSAPYNKLNTENLTIRGNVFNSSDGMATQTIFIKNETYSETDVKYKNITVEDNTIYNGHVHGVAIADSSGVVVANNTLLWNQDATMQSTPTSEPVTSAPAIRLYDVENGIVTSNIAGNIYAPGNIVSNNALLNFNNVASENYVGNNFVNVVNANPIDIRDMRLLADSPWNGRFGSSDTQSTNMSGEVTAVMSQNLEAGTAGRISYDASQSFGSDGMLSSEMAEFTWTFSDGAVLQGMHVSHDFQNSGTQTVTLTIATDHGTSSVTRTTEIADDLLVSIDFDGDVSDSSSYASELTEIGVHDNVSGISGKGLHLNGYNKVQIDRENVHIQNMASFTVDMSLKRDAGGDAGTFLHMHKALRAEVTDDGAVRFTLSTTDGSFTATTASGLVIDDIWHDISLTFGEASGGLRIYVDGAVVAEAEATGVMAPSGVNYDLVIGNSWGGSLQGAIDNFMIHRSVEEFGSFDKVDATPQGSVNIGQEQPVVSDYVMQGASPLLIMGFDGGFADGSEWQSKLRIFESADGTDIAGVTGQAFVLDGRSKVYVDRGNDQLLRLDSFTIGVSLARTEGGDDGTFLHIHKALNVSVTDAGALKVKMATTDGSFAVTSAPGLIADSEWHRIAMVYDSAAEGGGLQVYLDGQFVGYTDAHGAMASTGTHHLVLGNTWIDSLEGRIDDVIVDSKVFDSNEILHDYMNMESALLANARPATSLSTLNYTAALYDELNLELLLAQEEGSQVWLNHNVQDSDVTLQHTGLISMMTPDPMAFDF